LEGIHPSGEILTYFATAPPGGLIVYKSGTLKHLKAITERAQEFGYIGERVKE